MNGLTKDDMLKMAKEDLRNYAADSNEADMWYKRFCKVCGNSVDKMGQFWLVVDECCDVEYILDMFEYGIDGMVDAGKYGFGYIVR